MDIHSIWLFVHILLFVFWLGADVGVYATMVFVKDHTLSYETRATLIKMAFYIDLFPRVCMAMLIPVGCHLVKDLGLYPMSDGLLGLAWLVGIFWSAIHLLIVRYKGQAIVRYLARGNIAFEAVGGLFFVLVGAFSLATSQPFDADWFSLKILLYGLIFWVVLGIDTTFQPFTMILRMGPDGSTPEKEAEVTRQTKLTMAWALLLYSLILVIAFMGKAKPF